MSGDDDDSLHSLKLENAGLREQVAALNEELDRIRQRDTAIKGGMATAAVGVSRLFAGRTLATAASRLKPELEKWLRGVREEFPIGESYDVVIAIARRAAWKWTLIAIAALASALFVALQVLILFQQNRYIAQQNALIERDVAIASFDRTSQIRDLIVESNNPEDALADEMSEAAFDMRAARWPDHSVVSQLESFIAEYPDGAITVCLPLLHNSETSLPVLLAMRNALLASDSSARSMLISRLQSESGWNLSGWNIYREDFSAFADADIPLRGAIFAYCWIDNCSFQGVDMGESLFVSTIISESDLRDVDFESSTFAECGISACDQEGGRYAAARILYSEDRYGLGGYVNLPTSGLRGQSIFISERLTPAYLETGYDFEMQVISEKESKRQLDDIVVLTGSLAPEKLARRPSSDSLEAPAAE